MMHGAYGFKLAVGLLATYCLLAFVYDLLQERQAISL